MNMAPWLPILIGFVAATSAALLLTPLIGWLARRRGIVDHPDGRRKLQRRPVPLLGGVAVYLAMVFGLVIAEPWLGYSGALKFSLHAFLVQAGFLVGVGICDDVWNFRARLKLAGQIATVMPLVFVGCAFSRVEIFGSVYELGFLGRPLSMLWLLIGINAINLIDGMDGLASGVGLLVSLAALAILGPAGFGTSTALATVLAGSLVGFLVYNRPAARIYLGDAGSMLIGLSAAVLSLHASQRIGGSVNLTGLVLLMAAPLADTSLAVVRRALSGRGIGSADRGHIHHRLLDRGFTVSQSLVIVGSFSLVCVTAAYGAIVYQWETLAWLMGGLLVVIVVRQRLGGHVEWHLFTSFLAARREAAAAAQTGRARLLPFDAAWDTLLLAAKRREIDHFEIVVRQSRRPAADNLSLESAQRDAAAPLPPMFELKLRDAAGGWCLLRAEVSGDAVEGAAESSLLMAALKDFARQWSVDAESTQVSVGDTAGEAEQIFSLPPPKDAAYRRAA